MKAQTVKMLLWELLSCSSFLLASVLHTLRGILPALTCRALPAVPQGQRSCGVQSPTQGFAQGSWLLEPQVMSGTRPPLLTTSHKSGDILVHAYQGMLSLPAPVNARAGLICTDLRILRTGIVYYHGKANQYLVPTFFWINSINKVNKVELSLYLSIYQDSHFSTYYPIKVPLFSLRKATFANMALTRSYLTWGEGAIWSQGTDTCSPHQNSCC